MADLIDRQAALDTIMGQPPEPHYPAWYAAQIEKLPAVQPDHVADIGKKVCVDTISRQAALEELAVYIHLIDKTMGKGFLTDDDCMEAAKSVLGEDELPAAQPATNCSEIPNSSDDTISRQAAIDALARMMPRSYTPDGSHPADEEIFRAQEVFADCIEALEILPSAAPSTAHTTETTAETTAPSTDDWVPVKKRLPAVPWCRCLITRDDGRGGVTVKEALFSFGRWYDNEWLEDGRNRKFNISESVIAWAPFPAPYRGGEQDDR